MVPFEGSALDPLETLTGPQTPRRCSPPLTQNPGSAPDNTETNGLIVGLNNGITWRHGIMIMFGEDNIVR